MSEALRQQLVDLTEDAALARGLAHWRQAPTRVVLLGLRTVGKSTLVNLLAGERRAETGMGGVTREVTHYQLDGVELIDTPGLDRIEEALAVFDPLLADVDRLVWVVDGTQPVTRREREVLELCLRPHTEVRVVVSRLDLVDAEEHASVLRRVASLTAPWSPTSLQALDLRRAERAGAPVPTLLDPPVGDTPRRVLHWAPALAALRERWAARPVLHDARTLSAEVRQAWREAVRAQREALTGLDNPPPEREVRAQQEASEQVLHSPLVRRYRTRLEPRLPRPALHQPQTVWRTLLGGSERQLQAALGAWAAEGDVVLDEWAVNVADPADEASRDAAVRDVLRRLETTADSADPRNAG